jgi:hypothetical protein
MSRVLLVVPCALYIVAAAVLPITAGQSSAPRAVHVVRHDAERRVDIMIGGEPFTSYIWPTTIKKPVLYPLRAADGTIVTRGFPLDPRAGERVDHPHHVGLWFNYGDVNGLDFWNNSDAIKPEDRPKMGTIVHRSIVSASGGEKTGTLVTGSDWLAPDSTVLLKQTTKYTFSGDAETRVVDLEVKLTAQDKRVALTDNKEGVLGIRVARQLEEPASKPEVFTDASGRPTTVASLDNAGVNGVYLTSEGKKGAAVWGTRGKWCILTGTVGKSAVTLAILDRPGNPGYPTYWHARGYGLFAANPLGQKALSDGKDVLNFAIEPRQSATFTYRIAIAAGNWDAARAEAAWQAWAGAPRTASR